MTFGTSQWSFGQRQADLMRKRSRENDRQKVKHCCTWWKEDGDKKSNHFDGSFSCTLTQTRMQKIKKTIPNEIEDQEKRTQLWSRKHDRRKKTTRTQEAKSADDTDGWMAKQLTMQEPNRGWRMQKKIERKAEREKIWTETPTNEKVRELMTDRQTERTLYKQRNESTSGFAVWSVEKWLLKKLKDDNPSDGTRKMNTKHQLK